MKAQISIVKFFAKSKSKKNRELRKKRKSFRLNPQLLICGILLIAVGLWLSQPILQGIVERKEISALQEEIVRLQKENEVLEKEISALNSDDDIEVVARRDLGLIKPGEESYIVIPEDEGEKEAGSQVLNESHEEENSSESIWQQFLEFITNLLGR